MLEAVDIRAGYGRIPVLNGVSIAVATGEAIGLLGHNGMGKTTLLKSLMGYLRLTGGNIRFDGSDISRAHAPAFAARPRLRAARP